MMIRNSSVYVIVFILLFSWSNLSSNAWSDDDGHTVPVTAEKMKIFTLPDGPWDFPDTWDPTALEIRAFSHEYNKLVRTRDYHLKETIVAILVAVAANQAYDRDWIGFNENILAKIFTTYWIASGTYSYGRSSRAVSHMEFLAADKGIMLLEDRYRSKIGTISEEKHPDSSLHPCLSFSFTF